MKFSCPECQARYQVDLPPSGDDGVEVKCARCQHTFRVFEETASAIVADSSKNLMEGHSTDSTHDPEQGMEEDSPDTQENLDAFLDELIQQENLEETAPPEDISASASPDTNLDGLLENLLADSPDQEESGLGEADLDQIWDQSVAEGHREEQVETEEVDQELPSAEEPAPPIAIEAETTEEPEDLEAVEEPEQEETPSAESDEDLWAQAFADQAETEAKKAEAEDLEAVEEPEQEETPPAESDEDLWAQAFADQAETEAKQAEAGPPEDNNTADTPEEDLWAQAFADQAETEAKQAEAGPPEDNNTADTPEEDLWAQAFADQAETEAKQADPVPKKPDTDDNSEEDLWAQAFEEANEDTSPEAVASEADEDAGLAGVGGNPDDDEDLSDEEMQKLAAIAHDDSGGLGLADEALANYNEDDYADLDEDDEFETEAPQKKLGFIPLPSGKTGKLVVGGGILALLLIGGSAYFAIQTFAPPELVEEAQLAESGNESAPEPGKESVDPAPGQKTDEAKPDAKSSAVETAQNALLGEEADSGDKEGAPADSAGLNQALQPFADIVEMSTIMPVAYSPTDIKVLSFTIQLEMDQPKTAEGMRSSLPVYEKIMASTVERFLKRKFYNDILYVKEKLVKRLELEINKGLKKGKIKKASFKEFQIS